MNVSVLESAIFWTNGYSEYVCYNCVACVNNISKPDIITDQTNRIKELFKLDEILTLENQNHKRIERTSWLKRKFHRATVITGWYMREWRKQ